MYCPSVGGAEHIRLFRIFLSHLHTLLAWHVASIAYAASKTSFSKGMSKKLPCVGWQRFSSPSCNRQEELLTSSPKQQNHQTDRD